MPETRITKGLHLSLSHLKNTIMFVDRLETQPEFKESSSSVHLIIELQNNLHYSSQILKTLYQRAVAHANKKE